MLKVASKPPQYIQTRKQPESGHIAVFYNRKIMTPCHNVAHHEHSDARLEYDTCTENVYNIVDLYLTIFITIRSLIRNLTLVTKVTLSAN